MCRSYSMIDECLNVVGSCLLYHAHGVVRFQPAVIPSLTDSHISYMLQVISARRGEFETGFERGGQTREHAMLVKTAGVKRLVVVINKMDDPTVQWDEGRLVELLLFFPSYVQIQECLDYFLTAFLMSKQ